MMKRLICILLSLILMIEILPLSAQASETITVSVQYICSDSTPMVGSTIDFVLTGTAKTYALMAVSPDSKQQFLYGDRCSITIDQLGSWVFIGYGASSANSSDPGFQRCMSAPVTIDVSDVSPALLTPDVLTVTIQADAMTQKLDEAHGLASFTFSADVTGGSGDYSIEWLLTSEANNCFMEDYESGIGNQFNTTQEVSFPGGWTIEATVTDNIDQKTAYGILSGLVVEPSDSAYSKAPDVDLPSGNRRYEIPALRVPAVIDDLKATVTCGSGNYTFDWVLRNTSTGDVLTCSSTVSGTWSSTPYFEIMSESTWEITVDVIDNETGLRSGPTGTGGFITVVYAASARYKLMLDTDLYREDKKTLFAVNGYEVTFFVEDVTNNTRFFSLPTGMSTQILCYDRDVIDDPVWVDGRLQTAGKFRIQKSIPFTIALYFGDTMIDSIVVYSYNKINTGNSARNTAVSLDDFASVLLESGASFAWWTHPIGIVYKLVTIQWVDMVKLIIPDSDDVKQIRRACLQKAISDTLNTRLLSCSYDLDEFEFVASLIVDFVDNGDTLVEVISEVEKNQIIWQNDVSGIKISMPKALGNIFRGKVGSQNLKEFFTLLSSEANSFGSDIISITKRTKTFKLSVSQIVIIVNWFLTVGIDLIKYAGYSLDHWILAICCMHNVQESIAFLDELMQAYPNDEILLSYCTELKDRLITSVQSILDAIQQMGRGQISKVLEIIAGDTAEVLLDNVAAPIAVAAILGSKVAGGIVSLVGSVGGIISEVVAGTNTKAENYDYIFEIYKHLRLQIEDYQQKMLQGVSFSPSVRMCRELYFLYIKEAGIECFKKIHPDDSIIYEKNINEYKEYAEELLRSTY